MNLIIVETLIMLQIELLPAESKRTKRKLHPALHIDMTPMVDLGFLLITFFIFTTTISDKTAMKLYMPRDGEPTPTAKSKVLTVLLGKNNKIYAYEGAFEDAQIENRIITTSYGESNGIGQLIRKKQKQLLQAGTKSKDDLIFLIKPTKKSTYKNVIDALDETAINGVKKYVIVDASAEEDQIFRNEF